MDYLKSIREKFSTSSFSVLFIGLIIIASNLLWFLPTISSLRKSVSDIEKATVRIALAQTAFFLGSKETAVDVPARLIRENFDDKENYVLLQKILREDNFTSVALVGKNGEEVVKYDKFKTILPEDRKNISDQEDFQEVLRTGQTSWSKVFVSEKFEPTVTVNVPVLSSKKEVVGAIRASINVNALFKDLSSLSSEQGKVYVVDGKGVLISDPDLSLVLKGVDYSGRKIVKDALVGSNDVVVADDNTYVYENDNKVSSLAAAVKIPTTGWVIVFEEPKNTATANITRLTIFAAGSVIFITALIFFMRRVNIKIVLARKEIEKNLLAQKELFSQLEESQKDMKEANEHLKEKDVKLSEKIAELENFQKFVVDRELKMAELKKEMAELRSKLPQS